MDERKLPEGWEVKRLGDVCENLDSQRIPITKNKRLSGNIPYYGASGVVDYVKDYLFDQDLLLVSEDGANLLARTYPIAFSVSGKVWVNNHAHILRFENIESQLFIEYYLNSIKLDDYVSGMAQPKLNQKSLNSISIYIPPLLEQKRIVSILDKAFAEIEKAKSNAQQNLKNAKELFESYLQGVFENRGEGWEEKLLGDILAQPPRNGWSPPAKNQSETGIPVLTLSAVTGFIFKSQSIKYTSAQYNLDAHYWVKNGDLLITRSNTPELVGHVAICDNLTEKTIYPDLIMKINSNQSKVITEFLYYLLRSPKLRDVIKKTAHGANPTMKKINQQDVRNLPISFPSLHVQRVLIDNVKVIVDKSKKLEKVYEKKIADLEELKKSILQKGFEGEL